MRPGAEDRIPGTEDRILWVNIGCFFFKSKYMPMCASLCVCRCKWGVPGKAERGSYSQSNNWLWVSRTKLWSFARGASTLNHWSIAQSWLWLREKRFLTHDEKSVRSENCAYNTYVSKGSFPFNCHCVYYILTRVCSASEVSILALAYICNAYRACTSQTKPNSTWSLNLILKDSAKLLRYNKMKTIRVSKMWYNTINLWALMVVNFFSFFFKFYVKPYY